MTIVFDELISTKHVISKLLKKKKISLDDTVSTVGSFTYTSNNINCGYESAVCMFTYCM